MSAPPGFNETSSNLPDPGPSSAPIHVMRGGGMIGGEDDLAILKEYGLVEGGLLENELSEEEKQDFLKQIKSGICKNANSTILNKDCAAVSKVTRLYIQKCMNSPREAPCKRRPRIKSEAVIKKEDTDRMATQATQVINPLAVLSKTSTLPPLEDATINPLVKAANAKNKLPAFVTGMTRKNNSKNIITMNPLMALKTQKKNAVVPPPVPAVPAVPAFVSGMKMQNNAKNKKKNVKEQPRFWEMFKPETTTTLPGSVVSEPVAIRPPPIIIPPASPISSVESEIPETIEMIETNNASNYLNDPPNFQEGVVRMNFTKPIGKQVFANAKFGTRRTRIFGKNTSNIRSRHNSRKAKYAKEYEEKKRLANYAAKEEEQRRINLQRAKTEYETRLGMQKSMAKASKKQAKNVSKFESEVIKPKSMLNRFKGLFKRKTRRNNRK